MNEKDKSQSSIERLILLARAEPFNIKHLDDKYLEIYSQTMARIIGRPRYEFFASSQTPNYIGSAIQYMCFIAPIAIIFILPEGADYMTDAEIWLIRICAILALLSAIIYIGFLPTMWRNRTRNLIEQSMVSHEDIESYMNTLDCVDNVKSLLQNKKITLTETERIKANNYLRSKNSL